MRIFSILAAIAVAIILAMSILARPQLLAMAGMDSPSEEPSETANTGEGEPDAAAQRLVQVRHQLSRAQLQPVQRASGFACSRRSCLGLSHSSCLLRLSPCHRITLCPLRRLLLRLSPCHRITLLRLGLGQRLLLRQLHGRHLRLEGGELGCRVEHRKR